MAKWKDNKQNNEGNKKDNDNNKKDNDNKQEKKSKYESIRVPAANLAGMEFGDVKFVINGGNQLVDVVGVQLIQQPVQRMIDLVIAEVMVTEGHMKGSTAFWPYPAGADVVIQRTDKIMKQEKQAKRRETWNAIKDFITFKWW